MARQIGAHVGDLGNAQAQETAVCVERQRRLSDVVARMHVGKEGVGTVGGPLHRPTAALGRPHQHWVFGIHHVLHAEAAADVGRDHAHLVARAAQNVVAEHRVDHVLALDRGMQRHATIGRRLGQGAARLERGGRDPIVHDAEPRHVRGCCEGRLGSGLIAHVPLETEVARDFVPYQGRVRRGGGCGIGDGG